MSLELDMPHQKRGLNCGLTEVDYVIDVNTKDVFFQPINIEPLIILTFWYLSLPLSETLSSVFNEQNVTTTTTRFNFLNHKPDKSQKKRTLFKNLEINLKLGLFLCTHIDPKTRNQIR